MTTSKPVVKKSGFRKHGVHTVKGTRILLLADLNGALRQINRLVRLNHADVVVHVGNFGFFDGDSVDGMSAELLASAAQASAVVGKNSKDSGDSKPTAPNFHAMDEAHLREVVGSQLSELPLYLAGTQSLDVPVYTMYGELEDVHVLEKFFRGTYQVPNLHIVDAKNAPIIPGTHIRLLGVPGMFQPDKMFDIGEGTTIPGTHGSTWTGVWQIGELAHTLLRTHDVEESRWLLTCSASGRSLLETLAIALKCHAHVFSSGGYVSSSTSSSAYLASALPGALPSYKRTLSSAQWTLKSKWAQIEGDVLASAAENLKLAELIRSTMALLTTEPPHAEVARAFDLLWHCSLANNHRNTVIVNADEKGEIGMNVKNWSLDLVDNLDTLESNEAYANNVQLSTAANSSATKLRSKKGGSPDSLPSVERSSPPPSVTLPKAPASDVNRSESPSHDASAASKPNAASKLDVTSLPTEPTGNGSLKGKLKSRKEKETLLPKPKEIAVEAPPGLWFKNGDRTVDEILEFLDEEDRKSAPRVQIIKGKPRANGAPTLNALVLFETHEQVSAAYDRVNKDKAGTVSIYQPHLISPNESDPKFAFKRPMRRNYSVRRSKHF